MADDTEETETSTEKDEKPDASEAVAGAGEKGAEGRPDVPPEVKAALRKANKEAEALRLKLKEFEDRDKTEAQKTAEAHAAAEKRAEEADAKALRLEVAFEKGLNPAQAKRLTGSTREELEADADELLDLFTDKDGGKKPPTNRPKERLRGGGDPDDEPEETDPAKLAASIPVRY